MRKKGAGVSLTEGVLGILQVGTETAVDLFGIIGSGYGESYRRARRGMLGKRRFRFETDWATAYRDQQVFYSLLNRLKRQGLISKEKGDRKSLWGITKEGIEWLALREKKRPWSAREIHYEKEPSATTILAVFDIPEKEQQKRAWLRAALCALGFNMLQRSVWMGKYRIPEAFLRDLKERNMIQWVHILEITKKGTMQEHKRGNAE
ncbi:CRISPR-associated endonuclease Cas2 [Candidatus Wolfebacteria bacterium]|nr:CRISPR-associated endonuclease Cas2 [Candidatus Wolfebacteria bacterium]